MNSDPEAAVLDEPLGAQEHLVSRTGAALLVLAVATPARSTLADDRIVADDGGSAAELEGPSVFVSLGVNLRRLPRAWSSGDAVARTLGELTPIGASESDTTFTLAHRFGIATSRYSYGGIECELAPLGAADLEPGKRAYYGGGQLFTGLRGGGFGALTLGVELAAGGRVVESSIGDRTMDEELVFEARVRGDAWITSKITVGWAVGTSLLERGDWLVGVNIGTYSDAFGGP